MTHRTPASARPIFIVGSPRSGTSILTWALGQHSNIFLQEESSWMGPLALQVEIAYRTGTARGERSQLSALGVERADFFAAFGEAIDRLVLSHREKLEARIAAACAAQAGRAAPEAGPEVPRSSSSNAFQITRTAADPKGRWVDGSPEYSLYIGVLRRFFPGARFIHILREPELVVRSMLNFERTGGPSFVAAEEEAYRYWMRCVRACFEAEQAYGAEIIVRLDHRALVQEPEAKIRALLAFLGEPFESSCLEPLRKRINSSEVPPEFQPDGARADRALVAEAEALFAEASRTLPAEAQPDFAAKIEQSINQRVIDISRMPTEIQTLREQIRVLAAKGDAAPTTAAARARS